MSATVEPAAMLSSDPNHRGGRPTITGTGVSVDRISVLYSSGMTPEEIAEDKDLTLPQVYAALAYYLANRHAIDEDIRREDEETERIAASWPSKRRR